MGRLSPTGDGSPGTCFHWLGLLSLPAGVERVVEPSDAPGCIAWVRWRFRFGTASAALVGCRTLARLVRRCRRSSVSGTAGVCLVVCPSVISRPQSELAGFGALRRHSPVSTCADSSGWGGMKTHLGLIGSCCSPILQWPLPRFHPIPIPRLGLRITVVQRPIPTGRGHKS